MSEVPPIKRRRRRASVSPIDAMLNRERGMMETQMRRNAILQYVGEQLAELNEMLRGAGFVAAPSYPQIQQPYTPPSVPQFGQPPPMVNREIPMQQQPTRPCVWCGRPGEPTNVGAGVIQDLCRQHGAQQRMEARGPVGGQELGFAAAAAAGFSTNHTDARPAPPAAPSGRIVMHPTAADERAAQQQPEAPNGVPPGFGEIEE